MIADERIAPCRAIDLGCGSGTHAVWLAQQGFDVVGVDLSPLAIEMASNRAAAAGVRVHFLAADLLALPDLDPPFQFFFDRGCYHIFRRDGQADCYLDVVAGLTGLDARGLVLAGNAKEKHEPGPPVVTEQEFRGDWGRHFDVIWLREFRFDPSLVVPGLPLAWSGFLRRQ